MTSPINVLQSDWSAKILVYIEIKSNYDFPLHVHVCIQNPFPINSYMT